MKTLFRTAILALFIATLQSAVWADPAGDSFIQGVNFFKLKQYAQSIIFFEQAVQKDPYNAKAYWCLGVAQFMTGDKKNAVLNLAISNNISPNPAIVAYMAQIKPTLSAEDQRWVDFNSTSFAKPQPVATSIPTAAPVVAAAPAPIVAAVVTAAPTPIVTVKPTPISDDSYGLGIRFEPGLGFVALGDLNADGKARLAQAAVSQASDPSLQFSYTVPTVYPDMTVEPVLKLSPYWEIGLPISLLPVGNWQLSSQDSTFTDNTVASISGFSFGANVRGLMGEGPLKAFVSAGPLVAPVFFNMSETYLSSSYKNVSTLNTSSVAFGAQGQVGADLHMGDGMLLSGFIGYRLLSATNFTGTITETNSASPLTGPGEFYVVQTPYGNEVQVGYQNASQNSWLFTTAYRPLVVDLSSFLMGLQFSVYF